MKEKRKRNPAISDNTLGVKISQLRRVLQTAGKLGFLDTVPMIDKPKGHAGKPREHMTIEIYQEVPRSIFGLTA